MRLKNSYLMSISCRVIFFLPHRWAIGCLFWIIPMISNASDDEYLNIDPWDRALNAILQIMTGPTATTIGAIALAGTGYLFLRGRMDMMRLMAIIAGLALIFGAPHLAALLQAHVG